MFTEIFYWLHNIFTKKSSKEIHKYYNTGLYHLFQKQRGVVEQSVKF